LLDGLGLYVIGLKDVWEILCVLCRELILLRVIVCTSRFLMSVVFFGFVSMGSLVVFVV